MQRESYCWSACFRPPSRRNMQKARQPTDSCVLLVRHSGQGAACRVQEAVCAPRDTCNWQPEGVQGCCWEGIRSGTGWQGASSALCSLLNQARPISVLRHPHRHHYLEAAATAGVQGFQLTDFNKRLASNEDLQGLADGASVWAVPACGNSSLAPIRVSQTPAPYAMPASQAISQLLPHCTQERISFQPHPKTLTMAGELEYWAAQVRL